jgi:hypothetical protein
MFKIQYLSPTSLTELLVRQQGLGNCRALGWCLRSTPKALPDGSSLSSTTRVVAFSLVPAELLRELTNYLMGSPYAPFGVLPVWPNQDVWHASYELKDTGPGKALLCINTFDAITHVNRRFEFTAKHQYPTPWSALSEAMWGFNNSGRDLPERVFDLS